MALSRADVLHLAELAKLALGEEELDKFAHQLSDILNAAARLNELDTDAIPPTANVLPILNIWREDIAKSSLPHDQVMANAPEADPKKDYFRVKAVLD